MAKERTGRQEGVQLTDAVIRAYIMVQKVLGNENRVKILISLEEAGKTWSELMFERRINPKVLRDNLRYLDRNHLVKKRNNRYELTIEGRSLISFSLKDMVRTAKYVQDGLLAGLLG